MLLTSGPMRIPLLSSMAQDIAEHGKLRRRTATAMWTAYTAHVVAYAWALGRPDLRPPLPAGTSRRIGVPIALGGASLCVAGMSRFAGVGELEGTRNQDLTTSGIYRWSRNPQYLGYVLALGGAALARRSLTGLALTGLVGAAYRLWIPVEERQLTEAHGPTYLGYQARTRRWWGHRPTGRAAARPTRAKQTRASR